MRMVVQVVSMRMVVGAAEASAPEAVIDDCGGGQPCAHVSLCCMQLCRFGGWEGVVSQLVACLHVYTVAKTRLEARLQVIRIKVTHMDGICHECGCSCMWVEHCTWLLR